MSLAALPVETLAPGTWECELHKNHGSARPIRGVIHHVQPRAAGGSNAADNKAIICANGHDAVHAIMWEIVNDRPLPRCALSEKKMARRGVAAWVMAGRPGSMHAFMA